MENNKIEENSEESSNQERLPHKEGVKGFLAREILSSCLSRHQELLSRNLGLIVYLPLSSEDERNPML